MHVYERIVLAQMETKLRLVLDEGVYYVERRKGRDWYFLGSVEAVTGFPDDFEISENQSENIMVTYLAEPEGS